MQQSFTSKNIFFSSRLAVLTSTYVALCGAINSEYQKQRGVSGLQPANCIHPIHPAVCIHPTGTSKPATCRLYTSRQLYTHIGVSILQPADCIHPRIDMNVGQPVNGNVILQCHKLDNPNLKYQLSMMVCFCNPCTWEAEVMARGI